MSVEMLVRAFCEALGARRGEEARALFAERGLFDCPLLGQRLSGRSEIAAGLARIFAVTEHCAISVTHLAAKGGVAIVEGSLHAKLHRDPAPVELPLAIVLEAREEGIVRLALHLDARPYRLWSDGPIFAAAEEGALS